jgi:hypothetical protein
MTSLVTAILGKFFPAPNETALHALSLPRANAGLPREGARSGEWLNGSSHRMAHGLSDISRGAMDCEVWVEHRYH